MLALQVHLRKPESILYSSGFGAALKMRKGFCISKSHPCDCEDLIVPAFCSSSTDVKDQALVFTHPRYPRDTWSILSLDLNKIVMQSGHIQKLLIKIDFQLGLVCPMD
jgi:hypothetical protein